MVGIWNSVSQRGRGAALSPGADSVEGGEDSGCLCGLELCFSEFCLPLLGRDVQGLGIFVTQRGMHMIYEVLST